MKKGISTSLCAPQIRNIEPILNAGFQTCMPMVAGEKNEIEELLSAVKSSALEIENVHIDFAGINEMWLPEGDKKLAELMHLIELSAKYSAERAIVHVSATVSPPPICKQGVDRFEKLYNFALSCGVRICFENLRILSYLDAVLERLPDADVCFDCGHQSCFTPSADVWGTYGDKVRAIHLHDNDGLDDQHLIPFEGRLDWQKIARQLAHSNYTGSITLECSMWKYNYLSKQEFLSRASLAADKIIAMIEGAKK